jgi:hypothetical protein
MWCCRPVRKNGTKVTQDITKAAGDQEMKVKSRDLYNRIDAIDSDESQKLLPATTP